MTNVVAPVGWISLLAITSFLLGFPRDVGAHAAVRDPERAGWTEGEYNPFPWIALGGGVIGAMLVRVPEEAPEVAADDSISLRALVADRTAVRVELERGCGTDVRPHRSSRLAYGRLSHASFDRITLAVQGDTLTVSGGCVRRIQGLPAVAAHARARRTRTAIALLGCGVAAVIAAATWEPAVFVGPPGVDVEPPSNRGFLWITGVACLAGGAYCCMPSEPERELAALSDSN